MDRIAIVGPSGAGKSSLGRRLASEWDIAHVELDALYHGEDWTPTPTPVFRARVAESLQSPRWVVCGNYSSCADLVQGSADTIIWLDLPRWLTTTRLVRRSVRRILRREELWNGNRERWRNLLSRDPARNVVVWAWQHHAKYRARYEGFANGPFWSHARVHRLRTRREVDAVGAVLDG